MNNSYFILPSYDINDTYTVSDIFAVKKNRRLPDQFVIDNDTSYYSVVAPDNSTLEQISYQYYDRSDYWDVLMIINQMDSPFDLPKSQDYIESMIDEELKIWTDKFPTLSSDIVDEKRVELQVKYSELNDKHRYFKIIKEEYIPLMMGALNGW